MTHISLSPAEGRCLPKGLGCRGLKTARSADHWVDPGEGEDEEAKRRRRKRKERRRVWGEIVEGLAVWFKQTAPEWRSGWEPAHCRGADRLGQNHTDSVPINTALGEPGHHHHPRHGSHYSVFLWICPHTVGLLQCLCHLPIGYWAGVLTRWCSDWTCISFVTQKVDTFGTFMESIRRA